MTTIIKNGVQMNLNDFPALFPNQTGVKFADEGWGVVFPAPQDILSNPVTKRWQEGAPVLTDLGTWQQTWTEVDVYADYTDAQSVLHTKAEQEAAAIAADTVKKMTALQENIVTATQKRLDDFGLTRGYSSTDSLSKYQNISDAEIAALPVADQATVTKFRIECRYLAVKIAQTWSVLYAGLAEVQAGTRPMPTGFADIEPLLPPLNWGSI